MPSTVHQNYLFGQSEVQRALSEGLLGHLPPCTLVSVESSKSLERARLVPASRRLSPGTPPAVDALWTGLDTQTHTPSSLNPLETLPDPPSLLIVTFAVADVEFRYASTPTPFVARALSNFASASASNTPQRPASRHRQMWKGSRNAFSSSQRAWSDQLRLK